ncbi:MAG TPA: DegV family protein, partial [Bacteroidales bacterium]|nr:DegV family protein [Bacteroidales bacterium]
MMNYKILTDSACDIPFEMLEENNVDVIGLVVNYNGKDYVEDNWKSIDVDTYYSSLKEGATPTTSQITPNRFYDFFKPYLDQEQDILYVGFSSSLSGTFGAANIAKGMLLEEYPLRRIELIDTMSASAGVGLLVLTAAGMQKDGKSMDEITAHLENLKYKINHIFTVD